jgi:hypothetical protein
MKTYFVSLINALILITFGLWGYFGSNNASLTALIPVAVGVLLVLVNPGLRKEKRLESHIAVVLTFLVLLGLVKPLVGALEREDSLAISRVALMMFFTIIALFYFIRSFISVRKKK